ncbi:MAG: hypothetical protein ACR2G1_05065 [Rubrobacteraceae bacterium]
MSEHLDHLPPPAKVMRAYVWALAHCHPPPRSPPTSASPNLGSWASLLASASRALSRQTAPTRNRGLRST